MSIIKTVDDGIYIKLPFYRKIKAAWNKRHQRDFKHKPSNNSTTFTIEVTMKDRWIPHFLAMLEYMEHLGNLGASRIVALYSDGDGDFRPKFEWNQSLPSDAQPVLDHEGNRRYDAG